MSPTLTPQAFVAKWRRAALKKSAAAVEHFLDLCQLVGHPTPAAVDSEGTTFPFPWPPGQELADAPRVQAIAWAAQELVQLRDAWLNPPGASEAELKKRTLTNLCNTCPSWLDIAHKKLDAAVFAAYGWPASLTGEEILEQLLALNLARAGGQSFPLSDWSSGANRPG